MAVDVDYAKFFPADLRRPPMWEQHDWDGIPTRLARRPVQDAAATCIVLHGGGGNATLLSPVLAALELAGIEGVGPDLPGYGRSTVAPGRFTYDTWVAFAADLARREADRAGRPVALAGFSIGGLLAYHVACEAPEAVDRIVATNLLDPRDPAVRRGTARTPALARLPLPAAADRVRVPIRWLANMRAIANDPEFAKACLSDEQGAGSTVPLRFLRTWMAYTPRTEPEAFTKPVLLLHPGDDRWTPPELSRPFFDRLGGEKRLVMLENCGHAPVEEPGLSTMRREFLAFLGTS